MNPLVASLCALALPALATAQNGRTMQLSAPVVIGSTAAFTLQHPVAAAGNGYWLLLSAPQYPGEQAVSIPGFTVNGLLRIDPFNFQDLCTGVLTATGTMTNSIGVPNDPLLVGFAFDLQSIDLSPANSTLTFSDNELALEVSGTVPNNMVPIPAGTFAMGSAQGFANEQPVHQVAITRPFWMGRFEVSQAEYQELIGTNPSTFVGDDLPVETVSWTEAVAYCAALSVQEASAGRLPSGYEYRLPTEAEWEYCCRAGTTTVWNVGSSLSCALANFNNWGSYCVGPSSSGQTSVVGNYAANAFGLHDMHGNVWEWCLDNWDGSANYPDAAVSDPVVTTGPAPVIRGGGYGCLPTFCRSAVRYWNLRHERTSLVGFRVVLAPVL